MCRSRAVLVDVDVGSKRNPSREAGIRDERFCARKNDAVSNRMFSRLPAPTKGTRPRTPRARRNPSRLVVVLNLVLISFSLFFRVVLETNRIEWNRVESRAERTLSRPSTRRADAFASPSPSTRRLSSLRLRLGRRAALVCSITPRTTRVEPPWPPFPSFRLCADAWTRWSPCARS